MTFEELHQRAYELAQQRLEQRKQKLFFNSNDEFVREDAIPELLELPALSQNETDSDRSYDQKMIDKINHKYFTTVVFFGDDEV